MIVFQILMISMTLADVSHFASLRNPVAVGRNGTTG